VIKEDFGSGSIPFGEWVYTVFTYSKTNQTMRIYVNGIESSSQFYNKFINSSYATIGIGAQYGPIGVRTLFNGTIDDVMVFNRSLTATEVAALYANQSTRYLEQNFTSLPNHNYTFKAYTQDRAGNINSTEMRTVTILSTITPPTITAGTVQFILTINNLNNQVYIPGTGIIDSSAIVNTTYTGTSIEHWYVASYLNNILNSLVFIARTPGSIKTERNPTSHIITLSEGMQNSKSLLVFTSGDHNTIENRMELIENEQFLNKISPSFAHGLGLNYVIKILLSYSDIRIMDNMLLGIGYHDIVFKSAGFKEGYISINVSSV